MTHSTPTLPTFGYVPADPVRRAHRAYRLALADWRNGEIRYAAVRYAHGVYRAALADRIAEQQEAFPTGLPGSGGVS